MILCHDYFLKIKVFGQFFLPPQDFFIRNTG